MDGLSISPPHFTGGLLTKTILPGSIVNWISQAQLRNRQSQDVVCVGDDYVEVKELDRNGRLHKIAEKRDFEARICSAGVLSVHADDSTSEIEGFKGNEETNEDLDSPQVLILTTDRCKLIVLSLHLDESGVYEFKHYEYDLPRFGKSFPLPCEHLAVDPYSRAVAAATKGTDIVLLVNECDPASKTNSILSKRKRTLSAPSRILNVKGSIQQLKFLLPPSNDTDHTILLAIVVERHKIRAVIMDWFSSASPPLVRQHDALSLESATSIPSMLIPIQDARFLLVSGQKIWGYKGVLSGSVTRFDDHQPGAQDEQMPFFPGNSLQWPRWSGWCRPYGSASIHDQFYIIREDGALFKLTVEVDAICNRYISKFNAHCGLTLALIGGDLNYDILAVGGEMSDGGVFFVERPDASRIDSVTQSIMALDVLPNWASVTDVAMLNTAQIPSKRLHSGIFTSSGRQPFGKISEIRYGVEARLTMYFELPSLRSVVDIWSLPVLDDGSSILVLSSPASTRFILLSPMSDDYDVQQLQESDLGLETTCRTLAIGSLADGKIVQITENKIILVAALNLSGSDVRAAIRSLDKNVLVATIDIDREIAVFAERLNDDQTSYKVTCYRLRSKSQDPSDKNTEIVEVDSIVLDGEPLAITTETKDSVIVLISCATGNLEILRLRDGSLFEHVQSIILPCWNEGPGIGDSIAVMRSTTTSSSFAVACGLRDGRLCFFTMETNPRNEETLISQPSVINFSQSSIKIKSTHDKTMLFAVGQSEIRTLAWDGLNDPGTSIQNIWVTDRDRPYLAQERIIACAQFQHSSSYPRQGSHGVVMISNSEIMLADILPMPSTVPRSIPVTGTPNRLLYAKQHRCLVCASLCYGLSNFGTVTGRVEERRQTWPVIDFVPLGASKPTFSYKMQPGSRILSLLEWSFRPSKDKVYSFILVGGSYTKRDGRERGRLSFLQPLSKNWEVRAVSEGKTSTFDAPIYALALWDDITYVACSGAHVLVSRFSATEMKWHDLCRPFKLPSAGIKITVHKSMIFVSTAQDSVVRLLLSEIDGQDGFRLHSVCTAPRADALLDHGIMSLPDESGDDQQQSEMVIATSKAAQIIGIRYRSADHQIEESLQSSQLFVEAQLPSSIVRVRHFQSKFSQNKVHGVLADNLIGFATDGTCIRIANLSNDLYRRLCWLQRLCERSTEICPHSHSDAEYSVNNRIDNDFFDDEGSPFRTMCSMPVGLGANSQDDIVTMTTRSPLRETHVNGDILGRLLDRGGSQLLKVLLRETATRDDRIGKWVSQHLEQEIDAVDELMALLRSVLRSWL